MLKSLDRSSLLFLCLVGFDEKDVESINENVSRRKGKRSWKIYMKNGRVINV